MFILYIYYSYIFIHKVLLCLDDGEGMKHHKVWPIHAYTSFFESGAFLERPDEKGYLKGRFLNTQTTNPRQSLTTMISDKSFVAKLMQMVEAFQVLWVEGWNFGPYQSSGGWVDVRVLTICESQLWRVLTWTQNNQTHNHQPTWKIHHIPSSISGLNWSWDVAWDRDDSHNLFYPNRISLFLHH